MFVRRWLRDLGREECEDALVGHVGGYDRAEILLKRISQLPSRDVSTEESKARRRVLLER